MDPSKDNPDSDGSVNDISGTNFSTPTSPWIGPPTLTYKFLRQRTPSVPHLPKAHEAAWEDDGGPHVPASTAAAIAIGTTHVNVPPPQAEEGDPLVRAEPLPPPLMLPPCSAAAKSAIKVKCTQRPRKNRL